MKEIKATCDILIRWNKEKPRLIAKAGDILTLLHDGGTALVVQGKDGERFSVMTAQTDYQLSTYTNKNKNLLF